MHRHIITIRLNYYIKLIRFGRQKQNKNNVTPKEQNTEKYKVCARALLATISKSGEHLREKVKMRWIHRTERKYVLTGHAIHLKN